MSNLFETLTNYEVFFPMMLFFEVTDGFVDTALTLGKRVLNQQELLDLLLEADEYPSDNNPFNDSSKLQLLVSNLSSNDQC